MTGMSLSSPALTREEGTPLGSGQVPLDPEPTQPHHSELQTPRFQTCVSLPQHRAPDQVPLSPLQLHHSLLRSQERGPALG